MKLLLGKRWHRIPVILVSVILAVALMAGAAGAAFGFMSLAVDVTVREALAVGMGTWDNLEPYGAVDDVEIAVGGADPSYTVSITTLGSGDTVGTGFTPGESIVIPVNFRNGAEEPFTLGAIVDGSNGLSLEYVWRTNPGPYTSQESGQDLFREFVVPLDDSEWASLAGWSATIAGNGGKSGSAVVGAEVLFVKIRAPGDMAPGICLFSVDFTRE